MTMHDDEIAIDGDRVAALIAEQFPEAGGLRIVKVRSTGTVNAVYRLGDHLAVRIPRVPRWATDLERETTWLPLLSAHLPIQVPRPVFVGTPTPSVPVPWAVYEWIDGAPYSDATIDAETDAARILATVIGDLRLVDPTGAPPAGRRPLQALDEDTRTAIREAAGIIDAAATGRIWDALARTDPWSGDPVWIHTDLLRPNLIARDGGLRAVIDWGGAGVGDPAADVIAAWSVFGPSGRRAFRETLGVDDATWDRARGFALHQAAVIIPYYRESNPEFVVTAVRTIDQILLDERR
ncbi:MAG: aminoglycoside phosphotransferase family protein [Mycetocola sp.]